MPQPPTVLPPPPDISPPHTPPPAPPRELEESVEPEVEVGFSDTTLQQLSANEMEVESEEVGAVHAGMCLCIVCVIRKASVVLGTFSVTGVIGGCHMS